jgi:hypothetical protein
VQTVEAMREALAKSSNRALLLVSRRGQAIFLPVPLNP